MDITRWTRLADLDNVRLIFAFLPKIAELDNFSSVYWEFGSSIRQGPKLLKR